MAKSKEYERELLALREENEHLRQKLRLVGAGQSASLFSIPEKLAPAPKSLTGLESMYVQVNGAEVVENCNTKLAEFIGREKSGIVGADVSEIDTIPWANGVFRTLLHESRSADDQIDFETSYIDPISGTERHMMFHSAWKDGHATITIDETTKYHQILKTFQRYVSPAVVEKLQSSTEDCFKTERAILTVLFADLRGFTALSANLSPDDVKNHVNEYVSAMIHVIDQYEGTVDKIIGDEVMAIFGAPIFYDDHAYRAIKVAVDMQRAHQQLLERWKTDNRPAPPVGIGINTGDMVVGNIGCDKRMDYTVIGHHVNIAARLCSAAEGGEILVSEYTLKNLTEFSTSHPEAMRKKIQFKTAGSIRVKGIEEEIPVARVLYNGSET
jgi:class 3 adenylate cyclase